MKELKFYLIILEYEHSFEINSVFNILPKFNFYDFVPNSNFITNFKQYKLSQLNIIFFQYLCII